MTPVISFRLVRPDETLSTFFRMPWFSFRIPLVFPLELRDVLPVRLVHGQRLQAQSLLLLLRLQSLEQIPVLTQFLILGLDVAPARGGSLLQRSNLFAGALQGSFHLIQPRFALRQVLVETLDLLLRVPEEVRPQTQANADHHPDHRSGQAIRPGSRRNRLPVGVSAHRRQQRIRKLFPVIRFIYFDPP